MKFKASEAHRTTICNVQSGSIMVTGSRYVQCNVRFYLAVGMDIVVEQPGGADCLLCSEFAVLQGFALRTWYLLVYRKLQAKL
jgi:hypothetical protein